MPFLYMSMWSLAMIAGLSIWRLHSWGERLSVALITLLVLLITQSVFVQLTMTAGVNASDVLTAPHLYLQSGPVGWLALLIMPGGWLGPFIGLNLVTRGRLDEMVP